MFFHLQLGKVLEALLFICLLSWLLSTILPVNWFFLFFYFRPCFLSNWPFIIALTRWFVCMSFCLWGYWNPLLRMRKFLIWKKILLDRFTKPFSFNFARQIPKCYFYYAKMRKSCFQRNISLVNLYYVLYQAILSN